MSIFSRMLGKPDIATIPYSPDSMEGLIARWVQWGASVKNDINPISDLTGENADKCQPNDIWFLAGCFGGTVNRKCIIPANKKILVPVFNMWFTEHYEPPNLSQAYGVLTLNGKDCEIQEVSTNKSFTVRGVWANPVTGSILEHEMRVGGLWKLLDPLSVGKHELFFRGDDGEGFYVEATYQIDVLS